ncbi:FecR domain-containing protein [Trinickia fusca]|uniref:LysM peptidoglycan-binding domain-containing protein n=1 Tax=Trinickia fusca TaxID=2419777 RepID=A0A494X8S5_9BURK|nr:FecR domain-containing protein [Trinickia fusca]RKP46870.1 LysM peptidoglycan-binding domain-containing protein [Trinickia fusca]
MKNTHIRVIAFVALAAAILGVSPSYAERLGTPEATVSYVTKEGDTLLAVADHYLRGVDAWHALARLNKLDAPRRLPAGLVLKLPARLLRHELLTVRVAALSGPVERSSANGPFTPLQPDASIVEGETVRTGQNGFVTLEFGDGTHTSLPPNSTIELHTLRKTALTGATERVIDLQRGEVVNGVTHATRKDDRFEIHSPSVVAGVRGTHFRVNYERSATMVEVLDGTVAVDEAGQAESEAPIASAIPSSAPFCPMPSTLQLVHGGFGNITRESGSVGAPVKLLPPPELTDPAKIQDEATVAFDVAPLPASRGYRLQIGRDADLLDAIREARVDGPHASFTDLPDGTYFLRISAIDAEGLEGMPRIVEFERQRDELTATSARREGSRDYEFQWSLAHSAAEAHFRFVLAHTADLRDPIVDRVDLADQRIAVENLPPGVYYWTVIAERFTGGQLREMASGVRSFTLAD